MNTSPPNLCHRAICITDDIRIGAIISSYFNNTDDYFVVLESPRMEGTAWDNIATKTNIIASLRPEKIILGKLSPSTEREIIRRYNKNAIVNIHTEGEIFAKMKKAGFSCSDKVIECTLEELMFGLQIAKKEKLRLKFSKKAESTIPRYKKHFGDKKHCLMVEGNRQIEEVIAANYSFSTNAKIEKLKNVDSNEILEVYDYIDSLSVGITQEKRSIAEKNLEAISQNIIQTLNTDGLEFVTFVTSGFPYGYFAYSVPSTHLFSNLDLGRSIYDCIFYSLKPIDTRIALMFDPEFEEFGVTETKQISKILREKEIIVEELIKDDATAINLDNHLRFFPYDLLFICSHAGEQTEGIRFTINFTAKDKSKHLIVVDVGDVFVPTYIGDGDDQKIQISSHIRPITCDGKKWSEAVSQKVISVLEVIEYLRTDRSKWEIVDRSSIIIREFNVIKARDTLCPVVTDHIAGGPFTNPIIFNNACQSFYNFCQWFANGGARMYIGTLARVGDSEAKKVAVGFFNSIDNKTPLPVILHRVQKEVYSDPKKRIYISFGCHFADIKPPRFDLSHYEEYAITQELGLWEKYAQRGKYTENVTRVMNFLGERLKQLEKPTLS